MRDDSQHMKGYEREASLRKMFCHPNIQKRLVMHGYFLAVVQMINPELYEGAFERRPCERTLRYIGFDEFDEPERSQMTNPNFVRGNLYHSIDFNGATYTIKETGSVTGMVYFEIVDSE
ncbi:MAG: hypothetical protein ABIJ50_01000 [Pseudomonadota bacterium]